MTSQLVATKNLKNDNSIFIFRFFSEENPPSLGNVPAEVFKTGSEATNDNYRLGSGEVSEASQIENEHSPSFQLGSVTDTATPKAFQLGSVTDTETPKAFQIGSITDTESPKAFQLGSVTDTETSRTFQLGSVTDTETSRTFQLGSITDTETPKALQLGSIAGSPGQANAYSPYSLSERVKAMESTLNISEGEFFLVLIVRLATFLYGMIG